MRVIHLPTNVGGNPQGISKHLKMLGVKSETWTLSQNYFAYSADNIVYKANQGLFIRELKKILALRYIFRADIVFFNFGAGLFNPFPNIYSKNILFKILKTPYKYYSYVMAFLEVKLLKFFGKVIFIQYQGDDARQGDFSKENFAITFAERVEPGYYSKKTDEAKRRSIAFYAKNAEKIYALNPDLLHVLPKTAEFLPYSNISLSEWTPTFSQLDNRPLRIGHAPSHRRAKGTDLILDAVQKLISVGYKFELVLIEGMSNAEAKEVYKTVDVFVDQLFAGWYGGLAVEVMALGKPVIAYIRQEDLHFIPAQMRADLPIIQAEPNSIRDVLEDILKMARIELLEKAKRSRAYVEKWHDPLIIAKRIKLDMEYALDKKV